jgi:hypothetical protein
MDIIERARKLAKAYPQPPALTAEAIAKSREPSDHAREYFRNTCFFHIERAEFYISWNQEMRAIRTKKLHKKILD